MVLEGTRPLARAAGALVLVAGFVYAIAHWTALSAAPAISTRMRKMTDGRNLEMADRALKGLAEARASSAARLKRLRELHERSLTLREETRQALSAVEAEIRRLKRAAG